MRVALLSDIHGNVPALDAAQADLARQNVDQIVCLGDVAIFGPQPGAALARMRDLGCPMVMGNTDARALNPTPRPVRDEESGYFNTLELWGAEQLSDEDQAFIHTFQPTIHLELGDGVTLLCYHGSPNSFNDIITATTPEDDLADLFAGQWATIMAGGHTHTPMVRRYQDSLIVNPGSVGLPWMQLDGSNLNPAWSEYAILNINDGTVGIELRRTSYELGALRAAVHESGMPHRDWWLGDWVDAAFIH